jgi:NADH dehydrogenase [ubiquinone] 1 alpha subcomplex assembly factor 5
MSQSHHLFNRIRVRAHRDRAASRFADFLLRPMAEELSDRLSDINRAFPVALDLGAHNGALSHYLKARNGIKTLVQTDLSLRMVQELKGARLVADEEFLPFAEKSFDLVMSAGSLHWVNDLPGTLIQINRILKPDGLFLAVMPGGETLRELRQSLEQAELAATGGLSPRISPFIDVQSAGALLQRAEFAMPVVDSDMMTIHYSDPLKLMYDLRDMGETNALMERSKNFTRRRVLFGAMDYYQTHFADKEGRVPATVEMITLTGWKPVRPRSLP